MRFWVIGFWYGSGKWNEEWNFGIKMKLFKFYLFMICDNDILDILEILRLNLKLGLRFE